jgi:tripartite-type tricarboxylate transporter receptor subunit TctC
MNDLLGTKFKVIPGFQGSGAATLAMERGEVDAVVRPWAEIKATNPNWVKDGTIHPIVQFSLERHADLPDTPTVVDLAHDQSQRQLLSLFASGSDVGNAIVAPPGLPPKTTAALRAAFTATMKDPKLIEDARRSKLEIDWAEGKKLQEVAAGVFAIPQPVIERAKVYNGGSK